MHDETAVKDCLGMQALANAGQEGIGTEKGVSWHDESVGGCTQ